MRMVNYVCDRCGKVYKYDQKENDRRNLKLMDYEEDRYDICPECYKSLNRWFDKGSDSE